jgi:hypothetical protein
MIAPSRFGLPLVLFSAFLFLSIVPGNAGMHAAAVAALFRLSHFNANDMIQNYQYCISTRGFT